jgi:hypothetical protein
MRCETCHGLGTVSAKIRELLNGVPLFVTTASPEISHLIEVTCPECHGSGITHCCDGLCAQQVAQDVDEVRAHGKDERVTVKSFFEGGEYLYRLVKRRARTCWSGCSHAR